MRGWIPTPPPGFDRFQKARLIRDNRFSASDFVSELEGLPFDLIKDLGYTPDEMWHTWKTMFLDVLNKHDPTITTRIRGNSHPYFRADDKLLMSNRDYLKDKANKTGSK